MACFDPASSRFTTGPVFFAGQGATGYTSEGLKTALDKGRSRAPLICLSRARKWRDHRGEAKRLKASHVRIHRLRLFGDMPCPPRDRLACAGPIREGVSVMEDTNGRVRRRGPEKILAATLAAVAMLGCSDDGGGNLNPVAPSTVSAVSASTTTSSTAAKAAPSSTGATTGSQITVDSSMTSTRGLNADTPLTANFVLVPSDHDGSPFTVQLHFSEPNRQQASPCERSLLAAQDGRAAGSRGQRHQGETSGPCMGVRQKGHQPVGAHGDAVQIGRC